MGDLIGLLFLTSLGERDGGPSLASVLVVHSVGATAGIVLGLLVGVSPLALAGGALAAGLLAAEGMALVGGATPAAAGIAAALVEVTTYCSVRFLLWFQHGHSLLPS